GLEAGRRDVPDELAFFGIVGLDLDTLGGDGQHRGLDREHEVAGDLLEPDYWVTGTKRRGHPPLLRQNQLAGDDSARAPTTSILLLASQLEGVVAGIDVRPTSFSTWRMSAIGYPQVLVGRVAKVLRFSVSPLSKATRYEAPPCPPALCFPPWRGAA